MEEIMNFMLSLTITDIIGVILSIWFFKILMFMLFKKYIIKKLYKKCPKCGSTIFENLHCDHGLNGSIESYLNCDNCEWEIKL